MSYILPQKIDFGNLPYSAGDEALRGTMLRELAPAPDHAQGISQRTGQPYPTVRKILMRLEAEGYLTGQRSGEGGLRPRQVYTLAAKGETALREHLP